MASAEFLEQALSTDVDENAVNAIVGSLENQLVTPVSSVSTQNTANANPSLHNIISSASSNIGAQKYNTVQASEGAVGSSSYQQFDTQSNISQGLQSGGESLKVIYSQAQSLSSPVVRVGFPVQSIGNGGVSVASPQGQIIHSIPGGSKITMQTPLVIKQGGSPGQAMQQGMVTVPMTVSSSLAGPIPSVMMNKPGGQSVVVTSQNLGSGPAPMMPNVQILNMRPGAPAVAAVAAVAAPKSVATVSPRVVIGTPQMVGARPPASGITLQTLQSLQQGQQGHLLLKTENGQYQLLRVGPAPAASNMAAPQAQTLRLSTVPAPPGVPTASTSMAGQMGGQMPAAPAPAPPAPPPVTPPPQQPTVTTQKPLDNTKEKCRNFLANLLDLSSKEPTAVETKVRDLIQELIDAQVEPETFCQRLERLLNASPQPCLIGFLKKSLPLLRQSLVTKELVIEGINPPLPHVAFSTLPSPVQPVLTGSNMQLPKPAQKPGTIAVLQNIPVHTKINVSKAGKTMTVNSKANVARPGPSGVLSTVLTPGKSLLKDKEKKSLPFSQPFGDDKMAGDDDINDVAAMGGVNLAEESQKILGSTDMIGTQIRSCKDDYFVSLSALQARAKAISAKNGMEEPPPEVAVYLSHAVQERIKTIIEKLALIAQHRMDHTVKTDPRYEITQDTKGQLKFLEELDRIEKKRREDSEREMLMRAAKSRSKNEDPEQAKLKAKAKEMQRAEMEEARQREANLTALQAIGPRKKARQEAAGGSGDGAGPSGLSGAGTSGRGQVALRSRLKRIIARDFLFMLEQDPRMRHSNFLHNCYLR